MANSVLDSARPQPAPKQLHTFFSLFVQKASHRTSDSEAQLRKTSQRIVQETLVRPGLCLPHSTIYGLIFTAISEESRGKDQRFTSSVPETKALAWSEQGKEAGLHSQWILLHKGNLSRLAASQQESKSQSFQLLVR